MSKLIQIAHNAVIAKLYGANDDAKTEVQKLLTYFVEGAEHTSAYESNAWDGTSTFFDWRGETFPAGFVRAVTSHLQSCGYEVKIVRKPLPAPRGPEMPMVDEFGHSDDRYNYQMESVRRLERYGCMISQLATGAGKSRVANLATARIKRPTLFITTRGVLMYQMKKAFEKGIESRIKLGGETDLEGMKVGVMGDGEFSPSRYINVAMVQTLAARIKMADPSWSAQKKAKHNKMREITIKLLEKIELVILEEAHEASGNSYYEIMNHCKNAHYRLALTATPFMRSGAESNMRLMAVSGSIGIKISEKMLIDRGILAKPYFKYIKPEYQPDKEAILKYEGKNSKEKVDGKVVTKKIMPYSTRLGRSTPWQRAYKLAIVFNAWRNAKIVEEAQRAVSLGQPAMVLVSHKSHGRVLLDKMKDQGIRAEFIYGDSDQTQRQEALDKLAKGAIQVLIGSTILDVGVDVPAVGAVILAGGGKAEIALRQRIGRGLRAKKSGPNVCMVIDFADHANNHIRSHYLERRRIVEQTPGFVEGIVPDGRDFNLREMKLVS